MAPIVTNREAQAILAAAPGAVSNPSDPAKSGMKSWIPPRQLWAGGIAAILAWLALHALAVVAGIDVVAIAAALGFDQATVYAAVAGFIGTAIAWAIPPAQRDIIQHLDDAIVHIAQRDPESNVSYVLPPVQPPAGEAPVIVPPATK